MRKALLLSVAAIVLSSSAWAWGPDGHRMISTVATQALPADLPAFVRSAEAAKLAGYLGPEADRVRGAGKSFDEETAPAHFVDLGDDLTVAGVPIKSLPLSREQYDEALNKAGTTQYKQGYLPYAIEQGFQRVAKDFAYWRVAAWGEKHGKTAAERAWYAKDRVMREKIVLFDLGTWSHFVADGSMPMHASVHYNGWGNYPNPEGFTTAKIHSPFESAYVHGNITAKEIAAAMPAYRNCECQIWDRTAEYLVASQAEVAPVYRLEKQVGLTKHTPEMNALVTKELARGAAELRDMIVDAWNKSTDLGVGYPETKVSDVLAGKADPYATLSFGSK
jgi:hypothetical protein